MRILALSDLHGQLPKIGHDFLEDEAIEALIIAGDICPDFRGDRLHRTLQQMKWLDREFMPWLNAFPVKHKHFTWGNHDWLPSGPFRGIDGLCVDEEINIGGFTTWFSPWSPLFMNWAWMLPEEELLAKYADIPENIDIIVSHGPPFGYGDTSALYGERLGSRSLFTHVLRTRPLIIICGHIHGGRGHYEHRHETGDVTHIYNVASVDEQYRLHHEPWTIIQV